MEAVEGSASVVTPAAPSRLKPRARDVVLESKSEHAGEDLGERTCEGRSTPRRICDGAICGRATREGRCSVER